MVFTTAGRIYSFRVKIIRISGVSSPPNGQGAANITYKHSLARKGARILQHKTYPVRAPSPHKLKYFVNFVFVLSLKIECLTDFLRQWLRPVFEVKGFSQVGQRSIRGKLSWMSTVKYDQRWRISLLVKLI